MSKVISTPTSRRNKCPYLDENLYSYCRRTWAHIVEMIVKYWLKIEIVIRKSCDRLLFLDMVSIEAAHTEAVKVAK